MVVTQFGRVEFDPLRVPLAAGGKGEATASFANRLEQLAQEQERSEPVAAPTAPAANDDAACEACDENVAQDDRVDLPREDGEATDVETDVVEDNAFATDEAATQVVAQDQLPSRDTAVRHESAGKGAAADLDASPQRNAVASGFAAPTAAGATVVLSAGKPAATGTIAGIDAASGASKAATASRAALDRLHAEMPQLTSRPLAGEAKQLGYRTLNSHAVQLNEQARDSVFKQILFKLGKDGGEMRMRLDPPEFGELDLRMTVENGNSLRLSIGTERADLRDLLLSGLDQLKKELEQSGLRVTHADVHTQQGDGSKRDFAFGQHMDQAASSEADNEPQVAARAQSGWITAQGLDFWV